MHIVDYHKKPIDLTELLIKFREQHRNVYMYQVGDNVFFYRPLSRLEYRTLFENEKLNDLDREDVIVSTCLLYPDTIDMDNCEAGLVTDLADQIMKNSFFNPDAQYKILSYYRKDMNDIDNQITCMIHEAFPTLDIETMENWGVEQTLKYYSRAEWILHNIRGVPFKEGDEAHNAFANKPSPDFPKETLRHNLPYREVEEKEVPKPEPEEPKRPQRNHRGGKKSKLTPEKLAELKKKYPSIDWEHDDGLKGPETITNQGGTLPPALRPRRVVQVPPDDPT